jgi:hypothetical protein
MNKKTLIVVSTLLLIIITCIVWIVLKNDNLLSFLEKDHSSYNQVRSTITESNPQSLNAINSSTLKNQRVIQWISISLLVMSIACIISVTISFYLYRWRRILLSKPSLIVPEKWGKHMMDMEQSVVRLTKLHKQGIDNLSEKSFAQTSKIDNMIDTFMAMRHSLDEKDAEIRRLKKNYDTEVFRKFLYRFIRVDQSLADFIEDEMYEAENLQLLKRLMEDALDECSVELFVPNVGDDYRRVDGIADNPKIVKTEDVGDDYKIAEVLQAGYKIRGSDDNQPIVPAKVKIFIAEQRR